MIAHLSKPEYVHVLLNPLPVYGLAVGMLGLVIAPLLRTRAARVTAFALVMLSAASAWPVYHYGEAGYDRVKAMVDEDGDKWLEEHMRRGERLIYVFYLVAVLSASAIIAEFALPKAAAQHTDSNLVNPWGMAVSPNGTIWVSDNGTGVSTLYHQDGTAVNLVVTIPTAARNRGTGNPTGVVFNGTPFFRVTKNGNSAPALFIFVSEDGSISGWNPNLDQTHAIIAVDNGTNLGVNHAVYKSATLGVANGHNFLYASNFHTGKVETYDESFHQVNPGGFVDPNLPAGYAPFGIRNFNGEIFVSYAKQDHAKHDDVAGLGFGFVNVFDTSGNFLRRLVSHGNLNASWGLALVEDELWVGNFGDGFINVYDPNTGAFIETLMRADGTPLQFDGLWDMLPQANGVFFTAGIADEAHGLFGIITEDTARPSPRR